MEVMRCMGIIILVYGKVDERNEAHRNCRLVYGKVDGSNEVHGKCGLCMENWME